ARETESGAGRGTGSYGNKTSPPVRGVAPLAPAAEKPPEVAETKDLSTGALHRLEASNNQEGQNSAAATKKAQSSKPGTIRVGESEEDAKAVDKISPRAGNGSYAQRVTNTAEGAAAPGAPSATPAPGFTNGPDQVAAGE